MKIIYFFVALFLCLFSSCKPDDIIEPEPIPEAWEKFVGKYKVTALESGNTYYMRIFHFSDSNNFGQKVDSLLFDNFANRFILKSNFIPYSDDRIIPIDGYFPATDYNGNRWAFWKLWQDTLTSELENTFINDTILLYFKMDNSAFWIDDGTQYYSCDCKHLAVKISD